MIPTSPLFPAAAAAASVCAPRDTHAYIRDTHTHAFILYVYDVHVHTHVSFSSLISLLISGARKTAAAHSRLGASARDEVHGVYSLTCAPNFIYFACESCAAAAALQK
jgi:hypothetical protein